MSTAILINMHRILIILRADIRAKESIELGKILIYTIQNNLNNSEMIAMISEKEFYKDMCNKYGKGFLVVEDTTEKVSQEKYFQFSKILLLAMNDVIHFMVNQEYELAYLIIDAFHVLPEMYARKKHVKLKKYWRIFIEPIKEKWNTESFYELKNIFK